MKGLAQASRCAASYSVMPRSRWLRAAARFPIGMDVMPIVKQPAAVHARSLRLFPSASTSSASCSAVACSARTNDRKHCANNTDRSSGGSRSRSHNARARANVAVAP